VEFGLFVIACYLALAWAVVLGVRAIVGPRRLRELWHCLMGAWLYLTAAWITVALLALWLA
jgi:predicted membrane channel-forming protein YqfA (hemolysin III family)